jgi:hypothetical protein
MWLLLLVVFGDGFFSFGSVFPNRVLLTDATESSYTWGVGRRTRGGFLFGACCFVNGSCGCYGFMGFFFLFLFLAFLSKTFMGAIVLWVFFTFSFRLATHNTRQIQMATQRHIVAAKSARYQNEMSSM